MPRARQLPGSPPPRPPRGPAWAWSFAHVLGVSLALGGCLRPIGFPWGHDATDTGTDTAGTSSTGTTTTGDATTTSAPATATTEPATSTTTSGASTSSTDPASDTALDTTATTAAPFVCGDGAVDPGEDCDDGDRDDDDGCNTQCGRDRLIFVTDTVYSGDQIGGLDGGDALCRAAAEAGGLPRPLTFKAWLSDRTTDARDRLFAGKGRYLRLDGLVVARDWSDLLDGALENPIVITESLGVHQAGVWTGTQPDGTRGIGGDQCQDWSHADAFDPLNGGFYGFASQIDGLWTYVPDEQIKLGPCGGELAIYCIEQE